MLFSYDGISSLLNQNVRLIFLLRMKSVMVYELLKCDAIAIIPQTIGELANAVHILLKVSQR